MNSEQLNDMLEDLARLTNAVLEFRRATAFLETKNAENAGWPKPAENRDGTDTWIDAKGDLFDTEIHAMDRRTGLPSMTPTHAFRKKRKS